MEINAQTEGLSAIILAAGMSRRMGEPKLLLPLGADTLLQQIVRTYLKILPASQIIVVTGHHCEKIEQSLSGLGMRLAFNAEYEKGMLSSVKLGIRHCSGGCPQPLSCTDEKERLETAATTADRACFLALGDQPFVRVETLRALIRSHESCGAIVSQPSFKGKSGHPLLISHRGFDEILSLPENATLKDFVNKHPVNAVEVDDPFVLKDVDTPEDYQRLLRSETCSLVENS